MSIKFFKKTKRSLLARKARKIFLKGRAFLRQSRLNLDAKGAKTNIFGRIFIYGRVVKVFKSAFGFKPRQAFYCFVRGNRRFWRGACGGVSFVDNLYFQGRVAFGRDFWRGVQAIFNAGFPVFGGRGCGHMRKCFRQIGKRRGHTADKESVFQQLWRVQNKGYFLQVCFERAFYRRRQFGGQGRANGAFVRGALFCNRAEVRAFKIESARRRSSWHRRGHIGFVQRAAFGCKLCF